MARNPTGKRASCRQGSKVEMAMSVETQDCMTETEGGLRAWKAGTDDFKDINGKLDAILMWNDITADFTSEITGEGITLPIFVYGGEFSLVPFNLMKWLTARAATRAISGYSAKRVITLHF